MDTGSVLCKRRVLLVHIYSACRAEICERLVPLKIQLKYVQGREQSNVVCGVNVGTAYSFISTQIDVEIGMEFFKWIKFLPKTLTWGCS